MKTSQFAWYITIATSLLIVNTIFHAKPKEFTEFTEAISITDGMSKHRQSHITLTITNNYLN